MSAITDLNPVYYETLYAERLREVVDATVKDLKLQEERQAGFLKNVVERIAAMAYAEGLRDGFTQGVAAEAARVGKGAG